MPVGRVLKHQKDRFVGKFTIDKIQHAINIVGFDPQSKDSFLRLFNFLADKKESLKERTRSKNLLRQCLEKWLRCDLNKLNASLENAKRNNSHIAHSSLFCAESVKVNNINRNTEDFSGCQIVGK